MTITDQFREKPVLQLAVCKAEHVLLCRGTGDGTQVGAGGAVRGQARQPDGEHPDVVLLGFSGGPHSAGATRVVAAVRQQQRHPQAAGRRLTAEHLRGVGEGVGRVGAVADEGHGGNSALEDVQVLPVPEVVLHLHSAAVLQRCQA